MTTKHSTTSAPDHNLPILTVGEISQALKRHVEQAFGFVRVRGEISGFKRAPSGHLYLSLKDETAVLTGVCWRGTASRLSLNPEDGMEVVATGRLTTYPGRSQYQIVVESMELAGEGALLKLLEDRKKRLAADGLFDAERKKPLPYLPTVIGVVTSPTGAVIQDILHRLGDRFPRRVLIWPALVQGDGAAEQVAAAIRGFGDLPPGGAVPRPDVLIVARGGGSLEDLWAFNEEVVVRAVADCAIPVISAVGHETDTTLIDYASDVRAPTPTAAAEMAVPVRMDLVGQVMVAGSRLVEAMARGIAERRVRLDGLARALPRPVRIIEETRQRLDDWSERLGNSLSVGLDLRQRRLAQASGRLKSPAQRIEHEASRLEAEARALSAATRAALRECRARLHGAAVVLESLSYQRVLERGFVLVHGRDGQPVTRARDATPGMNIGLEFSDGAVAATVDGHDPAPKPRRRPSKPSDGAQGSLL
jgi:exodeoxyribonuclease VII large subunit